MISVGIPFFNAGDTLFEAIRSVFAQTVEDWELILFDDGSTDGSAAIARGIADSRVRVCGWEQNQGLPSCLNEIAALARGEYLARMDADDVMHPLRLERQVRFLEANPGVDLVGSAAYIIDGAGKPVGMRGEVAPPASVGKLLRKNLILHPAILGRTRWFRENPYDPDYLRSEDHELWCRTSGRTAFGHIAEPLLLVRNAAQGAVRKYAESCRSDRRIFWKYGPEAVGWVPTAALIAGAWLKPAVYGLAARLGWEAWVLRRRNDPISERQVEEAEEVLRSLAETRVPGPPDFERCFRQDCPRDVSISSSSG